MKLTCNTIYLLKRNAKCCVKKKKKTPEKFIVEKSNYTFDDKN